MAICVMTGGSTGIGAATRKKLLDAGHEVFNIDYKGGDFDADLSTPVVGWHHRLDGPGFG